MIYSAEIIVAGRPASRQGGGFMRNRAGKTVRFLRTQQFPCGATLLVVAAAFAAQPRQTTITGAAPSYEPYANVVHHGAPAWSPDDREILYSELHTRKTAGHLYRVPSAGGAGRRVFQNDAWSAAAAWSPDGKRIALAWEDAQGKHIWTADAGGNDLRQVTRGVGGFDHSPAWSPDGKLIAYMSLKGQTPEIMIAAADGASVSKFATGYRPRFSPDGKTIAYTAGIPRLLGGPIWAVYVKDIAGGEPRLLASTKGAMKAWPSGADWSPDGRQIVFVRHLRNGSELLAVDVASDRVARTVPLEGTAHDPVWSHDGKQIAFMLQTSSHPGEIHSLRLDTGGKPVPVTRQARHRPSRQVRYPSANGAAIPAYLFEPAQGKHKGRAGLIWVHGGEPGAESVDDTFHPDIQYFVDQGFVVLVPDFRAGEEVSDIGEGARFLSEKAGVDASRTGLVGFSFGGYLSLLTAARTERAFAAVVDFFGPTDLAALYQDARPYRAAIARRLGGTPDEKPERYREFSLISHAEQIAPPVLILHGTADQIIPIRHSIGLAEALKAAGKEVRFITLGSGHGFDMEDDMRAFPAAANFLAAHLR
jgi:dipeptidyl aminopeptidase/acylaminoacyl peptidase